MELLMGQIVTSRAGRDVTKAYMVAGEKGGRVLLVDGSKRTLAAPKSKNIRHITPTKTILPPDIVQNDIEIRKALAAYTKSREQQSHLQGG